MPRRATLGRATATICLALVVLAAGCGGSGKGPTRGPSSPLLPSSPTALPPLSPAAFQELLTQVRGKPVVVNFWASWCGPCRQEAGELASVSKSHDGAVQFLGVDVKDTVTAARAFIEQYGWSYPSVFDEAGAIQDSLGLIGLPQTVVFDSAGRRLVVHSGPVTRQILEDAIAETFRNGGNPTTSPTGY